MSKQSKIIIKLNDQDSDRNVKQTAATNVPANNNISDQELEGSELFSFFTANIIKEEKIFTR